MLHQEIFDGLESQTVKVIKLAHAVFLVDAVDFIKPFLGLTKTLLRTHSPKREIADDFINRDNLSAVKIHMRCEVEIIMRISQRIRILKQYFSAAGWHQCEVVQSMPRFACLINFPEGVMTFRLPHARS